MEAQNDYEISYLIHPKTGEEARQKLDSTVDEKVAELAGSLQHASPNLRRRLAYPINKDPSAFLRTIQIKLDPAKVHDFEQFLKKAEGLMRFSLLKTAKRQEVAVESLVTEGPNKKEEKDKTEKPAKEVTMKEVEKGIEEALTEEVK